MSQSNFCNYKIEVPEDIQDKCLCFANECYLTNLDEYKKRKQTNETLIIQQIFNGKMAEFAVYLYYSLQGKDCTIPDLTIYKKRKKSFDADLRLKDFKIHVKSQDSESIRRYGMSFLFQTNDPLFKKATNKDIVIFCTIDRSTVTIVYKNLFKNLVIGHPKLEKLKGIKRAVYLEDQLDN